MEELVPRDEADIIDIIKAAITNEQPLDIEGAGSKGQLGRPQMADRRLLSSGLSGVSMYETQELVMTAAAGTPMREIRQLLDQQGQQLEFEPVGYHLFYGGERDGGTIGGAIATGASGSRRLTAGAARDHLLGFRAISGRAETFKSGGRVIKNVTGYDLSKLLAGSFGTFAVMSEVTFKVMPKPETETTLLVVGLDDARAVELMCEATGLPYDVSCLAHLPAGSAHAAGTLLGDDSITSAAGDQAATLLRFEGPQISVTSRIADVQAHFASWNADYASITATASQQLWQAVSEGAALTGAANFPDAHVWRISTAPSNGAAVVAAIRASSVPVTGWFYDWAGGLIWLAVDGAEAANSTDAYADAIRAAVTGDIAANPAAGGHATLIRAPDDIRARVPVFHPQPKPLADLSARVMESFDPHHILNRGRLVERR